MTLFPIQLSKSQTIAFVSSRLGDSLLGMITVNNLARNGFKVEVFSNYLFALKDWFPWVVIHSQPAVEQAETIFKNFDILLHIFKADIIANADKWHQGLRILEHSSYNQLRIPYTEIHVKFCKYELLLENVVKNNNMIYPAGLTHRKHLQRIAIHPTSYEKFKNWLPKRFLKLAKQLQAMGYQAEFIVAADERKEWLWLLKEGFSLPEFSSLDVVARWLYESGWFIGNDSGIGHLASNLGIPTLTLGMRKRVMQRWRPSWSEGVILFPPVWLITRPLKEHFWKYFISVKKVMAAFQRLKSSG